MNLRSLVSLAAVVASLVVPAVASAQKIPTAVPVQPRTVYVPAQAPGYQAQRPYGGRRMDTQRAIEAQRIAELQRLEETRRIEVQRQIEARRVAQAQRIEEQRRIEEARRVEQQRVAALRHPHFRGPFVAIRPERAPRFDGRR